MSGLSVNGFEAKRLIDINQELADALKNAFGNIDTSADSVFGQVIGVLSKPLADLWEQMEQVYFSQYPDTANGVPLDYAVALIGISRNPATYSQGQIALQGDDGTVVPADTQIAQEVTGVLFRTKADATITLTDTPKVFVKIESAVAGKKYSVTVNGTEYYYVSAYVESEYVIATKLKTDATHGLVNCSLVNVTDNGNGSLLIESKSSSTLTFDVQGQVADSMSWWTPADIIALDIGNIPAPENTLNVIVNAVSGLDKVNNFASITAGRAIESDDALRLRAISSRKAIGAASVEAIRARILDDVPDVTACIVIENPTDVYDAVNLIDPHAVKIIVAGGVDLAIGKMIWQVKAAGIKIMGGAGSTSVTFIDSQGNLQTIYFFRPIPKYAYVDVVISETDPTLIPVGYLEQVQNNILAWGNEFTIGQEIIYQQLFGVIYQVPGILKAAVKIALMNTITPPAPGDWKTDNIVMPSKDCYAEFALSRITVA